MKLALLQKSIETKLKELDEGRNQDCWALLSFDGKDADLSADGCTGIASITCTPENVVAGFGGHKTACDPTVECEWDLSAEDEECYSSAAFELVAGCGYSGYWSGDDWSLSISDSVAVAYVMAGSEVDVAATAGAIVAAVTAALDPFREEMSSLDGHLDMLHEELRATYEGTQQSAC